MGYNIYKLPKGNGKFRTIADPDQTIREESNQYLELLNKELKDIRFWDSLHGRRNFAYIENRNCKDLVNTIYKFVEDSKQYDIFSIDVKDYFGSITKTQVLDCYQYLVDWAISNHRELGPNIYWHATWGKIWSLIHPNEEPFKEDIGIAQGNPLSPLIANIVGIRYIDSPLYTFLTCKDFLSLRYCDNIYIIAKSWEGYSRDHAFRYIKRILENNVRVSCFKYKLSVRGNHAGNTILGIRMGATKAQLTDKKWLRNLLYRVKKHGPGVLTHPDVKKRFGDKLTWERFNLKLSGLIQYAIYIDPSVKTIVDKYNIIEESDEGL